jgi:hypothetical protein
MLPQQPAPAGLGPRRSIRAGLSSTALGSVAVLGGPRAVSAFLLQARDVVEQARGAVMALGCATQRRAGVLCLALCALAQLLQGTRVAAAKQFERTLARLGGSLPRLSGARPGAPSSLARVDYALATSPAHVPSSCHVEPPASGRGAGSSPRRGSGAAILAANPLHARSGTRPSLLDMSSTAP